MDEKQYDELKAQFGRWGSWAVWNTADYGDLCCIERRIPRLHTGYVFVGLNPSRSLSGEAPWRNYHYPHRGGKEHLFSKPLSTPKYAGYYMTDIVKDCSAVMTAALDGLLKGGQKALRRITAQCAPALEEELAALHRIKKIILVFLFGETAFALWKHCGLSYPAAQVTHFSARGGKFPQNIYTELGIDAAS